MTARSPALLAILVLLAALVAPASRPSAAAPSWPSGFGNLELGREYEHLMADQRDYLRRETPVFTTFYPQRGSLAEAAAALPDKQRLWRRLSHAGIRVAQTVPLVMFEDAAALDRILDPADALHGRYLDLWGDIGRRLRAAGAEAPVLRIGHEMNLGGTSYPWSYANPALTADRFKALYRLAAAAILAEAPDAVRCWNPGKRTARGVAEDLWPGDDVVDLVGLDFYDNGVVNYVTDDASWRRLAAATDAGGPVGILAWRDFARGHGKPFAVPEWGLTGPARPRPAVPTDRPYYVRAMHAFFADTAAAGDLAFESYYNRDMNDTGAHQLWPVIPAHATSSRVYRRLFGGP